MTVKNLYKLGSIEEKIQPIGCPYASYDIYY
jgi:hypothetical protein